MMRASAAGFEALILTVDVPVAGNRLRDARNGFSIPPTLTIKTVADIATHPAWWANLLTTAPLTFAAGVNTAPSFAMKMFEVASSATFPSMSQTIALSNPRDCASKSDRELLGYRHPALASTGIVSIVGRRKGERVTEKPLGVRIGAS